MEPLKVGNHLDLEEVERWDLRYGTRACNVEAGKMAEWQK